MIHDNQFTSYRQTFNHIQPEDLKLQKDRVLIRDLPEGERIGSIWIPEICQDNESLRWGIVVAVGPGDTGVERPIDEWTTYADGRPKTNVTPAVHGHLPMSVKAGQKVLLTRRQEAEVFIEGTKYALVYEEQAILGVLINGKLQPLRDRLLVNRDAVEQKTPGGIIIPPSAIEERSEGVVVAKGTGTLRADGTWTPLEVRVKDHIMFEKGKGSDCKIDGKRYLILRERDVLGVLG